MAVYDLTEFNANPGAHSSTHIEPLRAYNALLGEQIPFAQNFKSLLVLKSFFVIGS